MEAANDRGLVPHHGDAGSTKCQKEARRAGTEQHARMNLPNTRRCCECRRLFVPNPRVGDRQVTCGDEECQRLRHNYICRLWHQDNFEEKGPEASREHYRDVVKPFRHEQPSYQRRWRLAQSLREIREQILVLTGIIGARLRGLVARGRTLSGTATEERQTGVITSKSLEDTLATAAVLTESLEQVVTCTTQLAALGI